MKKIFIVAILLLLNFGFSQTKKKAIKKKKVSKTENVKIIETNKAPVRDINYDMNVRSNNSEATRDVLEEAPVESNEQVDYSKVFDVVEINPEPPGGIAAFRKKMTDIFRLPEVKEATVGVVVGRFVVTVDGSITDIRILKEVPGGLGLGSEYKRVLLKMPKWKPAVMNGNIVQVYYTLPIQVQIPANDTTKLSSTTDNEQKSINDTIWDVVEKNPLPPNGIKNFRKYLAESFRIPRTKEKIKAQITMRFVVNEDGILTDFKVLKEEPNNLGLALEYTRILRAAEKWEPGVMNGRKVKVYYTLPLNLTLAPDE